MLNLSNINFDGSGFSWVLNSTGKNIMQTSYQIQLGSDTNFNDILWDSGTVQSSNSICVKYEGPAMASSSILYWRVMVADNYGNKSPWSKTGKIITNINTWNGNFITAETEEDAINSAGKLLRKNFTLKNEVDQAVVHVTALGLYELSLNGQKIGDAVLTPGWTEYHSRLLYQTWDVTSLLNKNENALGATITPGWFKGDLGWQSLRNGKGLRNIYGKQTALLMELVIKYKNGTTENIVTDNTWQCSNGPLIFAELYHGEVYNAPLEQPGWNKANFDSSNWQAVKVLDYNMDAVVPQDGPVVKPQEVLQVKEFITTPKGEKVLNFGQNISGWVRFTVKGNLGDVVKLRHGEVLDSSGNFYTGNLRRARNEIIYTLKGGEEETFEPGFSFQGFQYVCVDSWPGEIKKESFNAVVVHSNMEATGSFESSHKLLNQLHSNILWGLKGNFVDVPTDCPQRDERMGWTGDAQVFVGTSTYLMNTKEFFRKWLRDVQASQFKNGGIPFVVPDVLTGNFGDGDIIANAESVTGWGDAAVICPWNIYLVYGDINILQENYATMKAWVEYIRNRATNGLIWDTDYQLGDWVALDAKEGSYFGATAEDLIATAYYGKCAEILSKTAKILGYEGDKTTYGNLFANIKKAYENEYFSKTGRLVSPTQTAHVISLAFGITPEKYISRVTKDLLLLLEKNNGHLTTGFLGTPYFCQALADYNCLNAAYDLLLKEDFPSWLYSITKGATTIWEHWDGIKPDGSMWSDNMNSFNHYAYGSVGEFMYRVIAGIYTDENAPGYKNIIIKPQPGGGLNYLNSSVITPYGKVVSNWKIENGTFNLSVSIPHNTTASIILPNKETINTGSGSYKFNCKV